MPVVKGTRRNDYEEWPAINNPFSFPPMKAERVAIGPTTIMTCASVTQTAKSSVEYSRRRNRRKRGLGSGRSLPERHSGQQPGATRSHAKMRWMLLGPGGTRCPRVRVILRTTDSHPLSAHVRFLALRYRAARNGEFRCCHLVDATRRTSNVCFSNRPVGVKHFQTIHHCSVNVAHGLVLLFGIGARALPSWDSKTRRNNLLVGLAV